MAVSEMADIPPVETPYTGSAISTQTSLTMAIIVSMTSVAGIDKVIPATERSVVTIAPQIQTGGSTKGAVIFPSTAIAPR